MALSSSARCASPTSSRAQVAASMTSGIGSSCHGCDAGLGIAVGDAVVGEEGRDLAVDAPQVGGGQVDGDLGQALPRRPQRAVGADDLVVPPPGPRRQRQRRLRDRGGVVTEQTHGGPQSPAPAAGRASAGSRGCAAPAPARAARRRRPARGVPARLEPAGPPGLGLVRVDRRVLVRPAARVHDVVGRAAEADAGPEVDDVEDERRVHLDRRVQRRPRLPGPVADPGVVLARRGRSASAAPGHRCT